jgi:hypothetical protein
MGVDTSCPLIPSAAEARVHSLGKLRDRRSRVNPDRDCRLLCVNTVRAASETHPSRRLAGDQLYASDITATPVARGKLLMDEHNDFGCRRTCSAR